MAKVTIETLADKIEELSVRPRSLNEDFQLEAYRLLVTRLTRERISRHRSQNKQK